MTDRNLEESIYHLQKLNAENGVKQLVEEAAQLFAAGRQMEASALMEKAEAMMAKGNNGPASAANPPVPAAASQSGRAKPDERGRIDEQVMAGMAVKLADGLAKILSGAFQELERHIVGESRKLATSFEQNLERLQTTVENLTHLGSKFEQLTEAVSDQRAAGAAASQRYERLSASVNSIEEVIVRQERDLAALRSDAREFSQSVTQQMEGMSARVSLQQEEVAGLKSTMSEVSRKVAGFVERVDHQADVIRALTETQTRRAAALDDLLVALTKLKASGEPLAAAAGAGRS